MKIDDIDSTWLNESEHDNFKFKKIGIDKFKTMVEVRGKKYPVEVYKNGNKWIASYFNGALLKAADTKRFAVLEIRKAMTRDRKFFESTENVGEYDNWTMHDDATMKSDFSEYKAKEERKWLKRADRMGFKYPLFDTYEDYVDAIQNGTVTVLDDKLWHSIRNLSSTVSSIDELEDMVSTYSVPRDVQRIKNGFENGDAIPYPVILKGNKGLHIMSGNTRLTTAKILGITPKALIVDISE